MELDTLVVDLDGPVLDPSDHHYVCYREILTGQGHAPLSKHRYWHLKRAGVNAAAILACSGAAADADRFRSAFRECVEHPSLLALDRVQPGVPETLARWRAEGRRIVLATLRRDPEALATQLERTGLAELFDAVARSDARDGAVGKAARARVAGAGVESCLWIGDTELDIAAARALGCRVWAVTCGLRSRAFLARLQPDFLGPRLAAVALTSAKAETAGVAAYDTRTSHGSYLGGIVGADVVPDGRS
jgi:phosphoglycolate phosphatase